MVEGAPSELAAGSEEPLIATWPREAEPRAGRPALAAPASRPPGFRAVAEGARGVPGAADVLPRGPCPAAGRSDATPRCPAGRGGSWRSGCARACRPVAQLVLGAAIRGAGRHGALEESRASSCEVRPWARSSFLLLWSFLASHPTTPHPTLNAGETEAGEGQGGRLGSGPWRLCPGVLTGGKAAGEIWVPGRAAPVPTEQESVPWSQPGSQGTLQAASPAAEMLWKLP